jgi:hypothetical protein
MATIFKLANLSASDYQFVRQADSVIIYNAVKTYLDLANKDRMDVASMYVQGMTSKAKGRNQLTMTGKMQERAEDGTVDSVARSGSYDVAYPLKDFSDEVNLTDIDFAYMTPEEFQSHIDGVLTRANNTYRSQVLTHLFKNTNTTFTDQRLGSLTVVPIANGDAVTYPPVPGSAVEATATHFIASGYTSANISDTNNPIRQIVNKLVTAWGRVTGGIPCAVTIHNDERDKIEALTDFVPFVQSTIQPGDDTDQVVNNVSIPGEIIGSINGAWVSVWDWMPSGYMTGRHLGIRAPFDERIDVPESGLPSGLQLTVGPNEADWPLLFNSWRWRFGIGTTERRSAAVLQLTAGAYSIPTIA